MAKTRERVIVIDPASGTPFALMNLEEYEKLVNLGNASALARTQGPQLTAKSRSGMIDPDLAIWQEAQKAAIGDWGGDEGKEEDKFYMEPVE